MAYNANPVAQTGLYQQTTTDTSEMPAIPQQFESLRKSIDELHTYITNVEDRFKAVAVLPPAEKEMVKAPLPMACSLADSLRDLSNKVMAANLRLASLLQACQL